MRYRSQAITRISPIVVSDNDRSIINTICSFKGNAATAFSMTTTSNRAYFVYLGRIPENTVIKYVIGNVRTAGAGAQTAELGLFSTKTPPNNTGLIFTKIEATGTISSLTSTGTKKNTTAFSTVIPAGTFLWAGMRTAMATTQPTMHGLSTDFIGRIQQTSSAGALTGAGPWTGSLIGISTGAVAPWLQARMY